MSIENAPAAFGIVAGANSGENDEHLRENNVPEMRYAEQHVSPAGSMPRNARVE